MSAVSDRMLKKVIQRGRRRNQSRRRSLWATLKAHGAMNKERHVCARRRDGEAAGYRSLNEVGRPFSAAGSRSVGAVGQGVQESRRQHTAVERDKSSFALRLIRQIDFRIRPA